MILQRKPTTGRKFMGILVPYFSFIIFTGNSFAALNEDIKAYRNGRYDIAAENINKQPSNDPYVNYYSAKMYLYGYGELLNNASAINYFRQSAEKGFLPSQLFLGRYELLKNKNPEQAFYWFKKAADLNDTDAQMYCAAAYLFGLGVSKNSEIAKKYYIAAAKNGNSIAQYTLAQSFLDSRQAGNKKLGVLWLEKAVTQKNPAAQLKLAELYSEGSIVPTDLTKAKELIDDALAQYYVPAMVQMGHLALKQNDVQQAKNWYQKAIDAHYLPAEIAMSHLYMQPNTPLYNLNMGFLWMLKAAQNGSAEAQEVLATFYKTGQGVAIDENAAAEWKKKAEESAKGNPDSSLEKAARWLTNDKTGSLAHTVYRLKGILIDWHNPEALKENNYNQAPQMELVSRDTLFKPKFTMTNPNEIPINEYYDALAGAMTAASGKEELVFPRYPLDRKIPVSTANSQIPTVGNQPTTNNQSVFNYLLGRAVLGDTTAQFTVAQMYQDGVDVNKDIPSAIKYYELASAQQDLRAKYNLGMLYLEGNGVPADYERAIGLLRDAAFKGNDYAQYALAIINERGYRNSAGEYAIKPDFEQAMAMYGLAADNDYGLAQYRLAELIVRQKNTDLTVMDKQKRNTIVKKLYQKAAAAGIEQADLPLAFFNAMDKNPIKQKLAFAVAEKWAKQGNVEAAMLLGLLYDRGVGVAVDQPEAIHWYQKASSNAISAFILGTYYGTGTAGLRKDSTKSVSLLMQAANTGFSYADLNLAIIQQENAQSFLPELEKALQLGNSTAGLLLADYYLSRANDEEQMKQARSIYQQLSEKGDKDAQVKLGYMLEQGLGGAADESNAEKWYRLAAEQGQVVAQFLLGHVYQIGLVSNQPDYAEAKKWYETARQHYAPAAIGLGFINETVEDDYKSAQENYQLAAAAHNKTAEFNLGLIYEKGKGLPVDFQKAKGFYQEAAEQGHLQSMVQLAGLFLNDQAGTKDEREALAWYKKAANLGDRDALYQLGLLTEKDNLSEALHYYQESASKGNAKAVLALARLHQTGTDAKVDVNTNSKAI